MTHLKELPFAALPTPLTVMLAMASVALVEIASAPLDGR